MREPDPFIAGGYEQLRCVHEPAIRAEVELQYAKQMASLTWFKRRKLRRKIDSEVQSRLNELVPPDASY